MDVSLVAGFLAGLVIEGTLSLVVARFYTRPMVKQDTHGVATGLLAALRADVKADVQALLDAQKPGVMRGNVDPMALNERKALLAEERIASATKAEVEAKTFIIDRVGPRGMEIARNLLGDDTLAKVYATGDRWKHTLAPFLSKLPQRPAQANGTEAARVEGLFALE